MGCLLWVWSVISAIPLQVIQFTNPTVHLLHIPQCTLQNRNVHISALNGALWDMEQVHCGICEIGRLPFQWKAVDVEYSRHWVLNIRDVFYRITYCILFCVVSWWGLHVEKFSTLLVLCEGNPSITSGFLYIEPPKRSFDVCFVSSLTSCWTNSGVAIDLRHHATHIMSV